MTDDFTDEHAYDDDTPIDDGDEGHIGGIDTNEILGAATMERLHRQAYWHGTSKELFAFLFANCLFFAGCLVAWTRSGPGDPPGDPSTYITGLHTIRGGFIFALSLYGFWTAAFNIFNAQMRIWPYLLNGILALWVGVAAFVQGIGGDNWDRASDYLETLESKKMLDDILVPLSTIAPGYWLLSFGGLIVIWVILTGLMKGAQQTKAAGTEQDAGGSGRRRRR